MNRTELTLLITGTLLLAMTLGWAMRWVYQRMTSAGSDPQTSTELAENLHLAEQDRDAAFAERDRAIGEMRNRLDQTEAELRAAMDGLGNARREAEELRSEVERLRG